MVLYSSFSWASITYKIPTLQKTNPNSLSDGSTIVKSVQDETLVIGNGFQVTIPRGWTLNPVGESEQQIASFNAHPTENIEKDPVYFGIHDTKKDLDLNKIKTLQRSKGRTVKESKVGSAQTVQTEYVNDTKELIFVWYVKAKSKNFIVISGAPASDRKNIETLRSILKTIIFN
jgi:hypothetical protein